METAFNADVTSVATPQPNINIEPTPNAPPVSHPFRVRVCECSAAQFCLLLVVLLVAALYFIFLIFWLVTWEKLWP